MRTPHALPHLPLALALITAFAAGCAGGDGPSGPSFADSVSTAAAEDFADGIAYYTEGVVSAMNFGVPSVVPGSAMASQTFGAVPARSNGLTGAAVPDPDLSLLDWRNSPTRNSALSLTSAEGCTITSGGVDLISGDPVDDNGNGIPDDFYYRRECTQTDSAAGVVIVIVRDEVEYKEIAGSLHGMTVALRTSLNASDDQGRFSNQRYDVEGKLDIRSNSVLDQGSYKFRSDEDLGDGATFEETGNVWDNAFTPSAPITVTAALPNGTLTISGRRYHANGDDYNLSFTISTATPLAYSAGCAAFPSTPPFTAGVLHGALNNSASQASFDINFPDCGMYGVDVNGAYDQPAVVRALP